MMGLPGQTLETLRETVQKIIEIKPKHISIYSLILEEGTKMYREYVGVAYHATQSTEALPTEETERKMYWDTKKLLEEARIQALRNLKL